MEADDPLDQFVAVAALTLALPIEPEWRPSIRANLAVLLQHARLVDAFELPDETDPAPIYDA